MKISLPAVEKAQGKSQNPTQTPVQQGFSDARPETLAQLQLQETAARSPATSQLRSIAQMVSSTNQQANVMQLAQKQGPGEQGMIDVEEIEEPFPNCLNDKPITVKFYRRANGITSGWNDQDLFYADGEGALVQLTVAMVDAYWNPVYDGFAQVSGPDWTRNCEDYAKTDGFGSKVGDYTSSETLSPLIQSNGSYVINMGFHWMRVIKTGDDAVTIRQKDGESAVYGKDFNLADALGYIINKYSSGGAVYRG